MKVRKIVFIKRERINFGREKIMMFMSVHYNVSTMFKVALTVKC